MEKTVMIGQVDRITRQRNSCLALAAVGILSSLLLSFKIASTEGRVVMVPGLNQEVWSSASGVSSSYLEEASAMYLPLLLDLNGSVIDWKREHLFKYVSRSDPSYMKALADYFAKSKEKYKKFGLSTHFAVKNFEVNEKKLLVKASGQLISRFGERGFKSDPVSYLMSYEWKSGKLLLKEFVRLSKEGTMEEEQGHENSEEQNDRGQ